MKIRIRFSKWGPMKFVGHLDMMRYFQKAIRRAGIQIAYSAGYSPHQIMSFASPLGIGLTGEGEYFDIEVHSTMSSVEAVKALNQNMVDGVSVLSYRLLPDDAKNAMSIVAAADYRITFEDGYEASSFQKLTEWFLGQKEILFTKKTKKSQTETDLKPLLIKMEPQPTGLFLRAAAGSSANVKPIQVLEAMATSDCPEDIRPVRDRLSRMISQTPWAIHVHRLQLYADTGSEQAPVYTPLEELGEDIA